MLSYSMTPAALGGRTGHEGTDHHREHHDRRRKYVLSSTLTEPGWENTTILRGQLAEEVEALKAGPGKDIVCAGSVSVAQTLVGTGLVDAYRLFVYPVVMGTGGRLFEESPTMPQLELVESAVFQSGVVLLSYRPA